jgi:hypothetical protein
VDGVDDLSAVDSLQVDRRDTEMGMPELALDDHQRYAFVRHLDSVGVPELVRREATPDASERRCSPQLLASSRRFPVTTCGCATDHAEQGPNR